MGTHEDGAVQNRVLEAFARELLQVGNRTVSGGDSYDALRASPCPWPWHARACVFCAFGARHTTHAAAPALVVAPPVSLVAQPGLAIIVADSQGADPISLTLDCGPFEARSGTDGAGRAWHWGVRARIEATTRYRVCDPDPVSEATATWARVAATYRRCVGLPLSASRAAAGTCAASATDADADAGAGTEVQQEAASGAEGAPTPDDAAAVMCGPQPCVQLVLLGNTRAPVPPPA